MVKKTLELTLISAKDLKNVNLIGKMDPYVLVHLSDDPKNKQKTPVHQDAGTNPSWNYTMRFTIDDAVALNPGKYLIMTLKHEQTFGADKDLGEVVVPLKELLDGVGNGKDPSVPHHVTYQVRRVSSQKPQGDLRLSYKLIDMGAQHDMGSGKGDMMHAHHQSCSGSGSGSYPPPGGYGAGGVYPPLPHHQAAGGSVYPPPHGHDQGPYPPPHGHSHDQVTYPPPGGYPPPPQSHGSGGYPPQSHHPPSGYPTQSHEAGGYPPKSHEAGGGYPPQSHGTGVPYAAPGAPAHGYPQYGGYPPPPHAGYGAYPPGPPGGYAPYPQAGYAQHKPQKPKKSGGGLGMGLGAGLLGGAIGGLVLGEMVDDAFDVDCDF